MSLYNFNAILKIAQERDFKAIGSFNLHCIEMLPAFFKAAQQSDSPLMIQISTGTAEYLGYRLLVDAVRSLAESENVPTCLHLDHCSDISAIETAMDAGFSSVMYDGSHLDLEENIGNTRIVVEMARPRNITVEGELGAIGGSEDGKAVAAEDICFTTVEDAKRFVEETQVDMLAVSVGTVHGLYTGKAQIQHQRLKEISAATGVPLVLHGGTGVPLVLHGGTGVSDEDMRLAVTEGINKVNVGTEMNVQWVDQCKSTFEKGKVNDSVRKFLIPANNAVTHVLMEKIALFK
ncbi:TPA: ketose-bisphosphate aldolase [Klebsiella michiganensis]